MISRNIKQGCCAWSGFAFLALWILSADLVQASVGTGTLNVVTGGSNNKMQVTVTPPAVGSQTQTSTITGTVIVTVDADPNTGASNYLTFSGTNLSLSNLSYSWVGALLTLKLKNMMGYADTPHAPAPVTPSVNGGTFDGSLHQLVINQGTVSGSATADLSQTPIIGPGTGTGVISMIPGTATATYRNFTVDITVPVDFTDTVAGSTPTTVRDRGTMELNGTIQMPLAQTTSSTPDVAPVMPWSALVCLGGLLFLFGTIYLRSPQNFSQE
jgi:hypothetical protein